MTKTKHEHKKNKEARIEKNLVEVEVSEETKQMLDKLLEQTGYEDYSRLIEHLLDEAKRWNNYYKKEIINAYKRGDM